MALDGLRWWQVMTDRRPPQWASRQRIVRRSPLTRLRDFTPARAAEVVPTLVLPPQAGHDSCIVDYSTGQSQMQTILAAGLERLYALDWIGVTQETKDATIADYLAEVHAAVQTAGDGGPVNLVGDCQGGWLAAIYAALHPEHVNTLTIAGAPIDFHAGDAVIHESVQTLSDDDLSFFRALVAQGNGVLKGEFLVGGFIVIKPENEVGKQLQLLANVRDPAMSSATAPSRTGSSTPRTSRGRSTCGSWSTSSATTSSSRERCGSATRRSTSAVSTALSTSWPAPPTTSRRPSRSSRSPTRWPRPPRASRDGRRRAAISGCSWAPRRCATTGRSSWRRCSSTRAPARTAPRPAGAPARAPRARGPFRRLRPASLSPRGAASAAPAAPGATNAR